MPILWTSSGILTKSRYSREADLESAIAQVAPELFGANRVYVDVKKKIGGNIPDAYLIDLNNRRPRLYVVENELAVHDPLRHIAMQLLEFSLSFEAEQRKVQKILLEALQAKPEIKSRCESYSNVSYG